MSKIYVANWKMNLSYYEARAWVAQHTQELVTLVAQSHAQIVLCPSYVALESLITACKKIPIAIGAQNCSDHISGAYTGEVSVRCLQEVGCRYCIVGHSEQRKYHQENFDAIARKVNLLLQADITPIICIGEEKLSNFTHVTNILEQQLASVFTELTDNHSTHTTLWIAYEPMWAIGSDQIPSVEDCQKIVRWIKEYSTPLYPRLTLSVLYGGSITPERAAQYRTMVDLDGFLIGGASGDFQKFKNIVL